MPLKVFLDNFDGQLPDGLRRALDEGALELVETSDADAYLLVRHGVSGFAARYEALARGPVQGAIVVVSAAAESSTWGAALATGAEIVSSEASAGEWGARALAALSRHQAAAEADFGQGRIELTRASLEMISMVDLRTGMYNRQFLLASLRDEVSAAKRYKRSLSLCIFRLVNSAAIASNEGEERLTQVREHISDEIGAMLRGADVCAWASDDSFAAMLPETSLEGAAVAQSRMDASLRDLSAELGLQVDVRSVVSSLNASDVDEGSFLTRVEEMFDVDHG